MNKVHFRRYLFLGLSVTWMVVIFMFSAQQGSDSASLSSSLTYFLLSFVYPGILDLDAATQLEIFQTAQFLIRKCAHMSEYAVLWFFWYQFFKTYDISSKRCLITALGFCFIYACTDEFHQSMIPGRGPAFTDVLIDTGGALLFGTIYTGIEKIITKRKTLISNREING